MPHNNGLISPTAPIFTTDSSRLPPTMNSHKCRNPLTKLDSGIPPQLTQTRRHLKYRVHSGISTNIPWYKKILSSLKHLWLLIYKIIRIEIYDSFKHFYGNLLKRNQSFFVASSVVWQPTLADATRNYKLFLLHSSSV